MVHSDLVLALAVVWSCLAQAAGMDNPGPCPGRSLSGLKRGQRKDEDDRRSLEEAGRD